MQSRRRKGVTAMQNETRERLIELICESTQTEECIAHCNHPPCRQCANTADYLLSNGVIVPPCKVGDTVYVLMETSCEDIDGAHPAYKDEEEV